MRPCVIIAGIFSACLCFADTGRDYYKTLYDAGGLDPMISQYVCFDERPELETFFVFADSKVIRQLLKLDGTLAKLPKAFQAQLSKDFLMFRGYDKGVAISAEDDMRSDNNGGWVGERFMLDKSTPARLRFSMTWENMRYKKSVEMLNTDGSLRGVVSTYGHCEVVPHTIKQRGK
jgi:hypothetical protein